MSRPPDPNLENRILNAAQKLWRRSGSKALTMRAVARAHLLHHQCRQPEKYSLQREPAEEGGQEGGETFEGPSRSKTGKVIPIMLIMQEY